VPGAGSEPASPLARALQLSYPGRILRRHGRVFQGERVAGAQPARGRFERDGGQRAVKVGLVERDSCQAVAARMFEQPGKGELIRRSENDHRFMAVVRARGSVVERGVNRLASLVTSGQICPGDDVQAVLVHAGTVAGGGAGSRTPNTRV
jgi:hypothetical protein